MKLVMALCFLAVVAAAPPPSVTYTKDDIGLLRYDSNVFADGQYSFVYEQSDGQKRDEVGEVKNESLGVKGSYTWVGPDGVTYLVIYTADENGYKTEIQQGPGGALSPKIASYLV